MLLKRNDMVQYFVAVVSLLAFADVLVVVYVLLLECVISLFVWMFDLAFWKSEVGGSCQWLFAP